MLRKETERLVGRKCTLLFVLLKILVIMFNHYIADRFKSICRHMPTLKLKKVSPNKKSGSSVMFPK